MAVSASIASSCTTSLQFPGLMPMHMPCGVCGSKGLCGLQMEDISDKKLNRTLKKGAVRLAHSALGQPSGLD